jgi:uncharacterized protein (TIGR00297 family)
MYVIPPSDWLLLVILFAGLVALIGSAEWMTRRGAWPAERTRKVVHILTGLLVLPTPYLFRTPAPLWLISGVFVVFNAVALAGNRVATLSAGRRQSFGTVFFPIAFALLVGLFWQEKPVIVVAMAALAVGDALAAAVGTTVRRPHRVRLSPDPKSLEGSLAMFFSTAILAGLGLWLLPGVPLLPIGLVLWGALVVGLCATAAEVVSYRGSDNLTVPAVAAFVASLFVRYPATDIAAFSVGLVVALALGLISYRLRFLDAGGAVMMFLMGTLIFGAAGWPFAVPIVVFFISSSLLSKMGRRQKEPLRTVFQKSGRRDLGQVIANGLVPTVLALAWYLDPRPVWYLLYLAAIAAVTADTWATEIGVLSRWHPRSIVTGKPVARGTSGGVTVPGLTGAAAGSVMIAAVSGLAPAGAVLSVGTALWVSASGFLAHLVDSVLGATVQAQYLCAHCGQITERRQHCGSTDGRLYRGLPWIDNDLVNTACAISGAGILLAGRSFVRYSAMAT